MNRCIFVGRLTMGSGGEFFRESPDVDCQIYCGGGPDTKERRRTRSRLFLTVWHSIGKQSLWNSIGTVVCVWW